jgi:hypothetical protein
MDGISNTNETGSQNEDLKHWLVNLIDAFRRLDETPNSEHIDVDLRYKCQIEVFWLDYPQAQLIAVTHDDERGDKEVEIHGPYSFDQLIDVIADTMRTPRWSKPLPKSEHSEPDSDHAITFGQSFEQAVLGVLRTLRENPFEKTINIVIHFGLHDSCLLFRGNIFYSTKNGGYAENDYESVAEDMIMSNSIVPAFANFFEEEERVKLSWLKAHGSFFYPPSWIGTKPKPSFKHEAYGWHVRKNNEVDETLNGRRIVIDSRGLVAIESDRPNEVHKDLNLFFGCLALAGVNCYKVNEADIQSARIGPSEIFLSSELPANSLRARLSEANAFNEISDFREVPVQTLCDSIKQAELISTSAISSDFLLWFEGYNHYQHNEYDQSFIMSWIVVEKQLHRLFLNHLTRLEKKKRLDKTKNKKLKRIQSVATLLLFLRATNRINARDYGTLSELNQKRNDFVHDGASLTSQDSKKCLKCSERIIKNLLSDLS